MSINIPENGINLLREEGLEVTVWSGDIPMTPSQLLYATREHQLLLSSSVYRLDRSFLESNRHLKLISQFAAGYDNIDITSARELGIPVANTPFAMVDATADICFALLMAVSRKMFYMHKGILRGDWGHFRPRAYLGIELKGRTLGIFGMGRIGTEFARRCVGAYGMAVIYHNRNRNEEAERELGAIPVSFNELLERSDIISVHAALTTDTSEKFNKSAFQRMKPTAIFLNTARGGIHHEGDLTVALEKGRIWGAGLDVTNPEPMAADNPLLQLENVAITPHIGSATIDARDEMSRLAAWNILQFCRGEKVTHLVT